jgi:hypothetical protein
VSLADPMTDSQPTTRERVRLVDTVVVTVCGGKVGAQV